MAPSLIPFAILFLGATIGSMDVAMNAHGIAVEKALERPIMSLLHGGFSVGGMARSLPPGPWRIWATSPTLPCRRGLTSCFSSRSVRLPPLDRQGALRPSSGGRPRPIGLGFLCFLTLMAEGSVVDWSGIHFTTEFKSMLAPQGQGALFSAAWRIALLGDRLRQKWFGSHGSWQCTSDRRENCACCQRISPYRRWRPSRSPASESATSCPYCSLAAGGLSRPLRDAASPPSPRLATRVPGGPAADRFRRRVTTLATPWLTGRAALIIAAFGKRGRRLAPTRPRPI